MSFRSDLDAIVLGMLQTGSLHGYEISKRINAQGASALRTKEGQIYPILHRLENEGKVVAHWEAQEGKPGRKVYSITEAGQGSLAVHRDTWQEFASAVNQILMPMEEITTHG